MISITISEGIENIEMNTFIDNEMEKLYVTEDTQSMKDLAFASLVEENIVINLGMIRDIEDLVNEKWTIKDFSYKGTTIIGFSEVGKKKFIKNKDVILPTVNEEGNAITEIGEEAFLIADYSTKQDPNIGLNSVKIPDTVEIIGKSAFRYNCLRYIHIPNNVHTIGELAFNANTINSLNIPDNVENIGEGAFTMNLISSLTIPSGMKVIPAAFAFNKLTTLKIHEGIIKINDLAFSDNKLTELKLPDTLKYLSGFNNNNLKYIDIPRNVEKIGFKAFASNKITSVTIPGNVKVIGKRAFWNTWHDQFLKTIILEEGVEKLEEYSFESNQLKDVNIPSSLKNIGKGAFNRNLGYEGVVHLYTPDNNNLHNIVDSKSHTINPAKITIRYKFEDEILKKMFVYKNQDTGGYYHIGDTGVNIVPKYNENELNDKNKYIDLLKKENIVDFICKKREAKDKTIIKSIGEVGSVVVELGMEEDIALSKLSKKTFITDINGENHDVNLNWTIANYDSNIPGEYKAIGTFTLPKSINQSYPETTLEAQSFIRIKEKPNNNNIWKVDDFKYEAETIIGLSYSGMEKIKFNKDLVISKTNLSGERIRYIGSNAFRELGLNSVTIPEGILEIDTFALYKNNLSYLDFPSTINKVGNQAFANNQLIDVMFPRGGKTLCLDSLSFLGNKLTNVTILKEVKKIHKEAFKDNLGYGYDSNKVHIYSSKIDSDNNGLFKYSKFHRIFSLDK